MPWVRFLEEFDYRPHNGTTIHYPKNWEGTVPAACVMAAGERCVPAERPSDMQSGNAMSAPF